MGLKRLSRGGPDVLSFQHASMGLQTHERCRAPRGHVRQRGAKGGCNLVVYTQQLDDGDKLSVHDPRGDLPKNQDSWLR